MQFLLYLKLVHCLTFDQNTQLRDKNVDDLRENPWGKGEGEGCLTFI